MQGGLGCRQELERVVAGRRDCKTVVDPGLFQNSIRKVVLGDEEGVRYFIVQNSRRIRTQPSPVSGCLISKWLPPNQAALPFPASVRIERSCMRLGMHQACRCMEWYAKGGLPWKRYETLEDTTVEDLATER